MLSKKIFKQFVAVILIALHSVSCNTSKITIVLDKSKAFIENQVDNNNVETEFQEFVLYTLSNLNSDKTDIMLEKVSNKEPRHIFHIALKIMALARIDNVKYINKIREASQLLIDLQDDAGKWPYFADAKMETISSEPHPDKNSITKRKRPIKGIYTSRRCTDHYAALGIFFAHRAGLLFQRNLIEKAREHWLKLQNEDGGWTCCICRGPDFGGAAAFALVSIAIYDQILGLDPKKDEAFQKGIKFLVKVLNKEFILNEQSRWPYYRIHSIAQLASLYQLKDLEKWRRNTAEELIELQQPDGTFEPWDYKKIADTCHVILFLTDNFGR